MRILLYLMLFSVMALAQPVAFDFEYVGPAEQTEGMHTWGAAQFMGKEICLNVCF
jgi:hypothetical protein